MVRSLADRTFQLSRRPAEAQEGAPGLLREELREALPVLRVEATPDLRQCRTRLIKRSAFKFNIEQLILKVAPSVKSN